MQRAAANRGGAVIVVAGSQQQDSVADLGDSVAAEAAYSLMAALMMRSAAGFAGPRVTLTTILPAVDKPIARTLISPEPPASLVALMALNEAGVLKE